jgi:hypothetical protein
MRFSTLGSTGIKVSCIGLGTATFGVAPLADEAERLVGRALDLGINLVDTANSYGNQARFDPRRRTAGCGAGVGRGDRRARPPCAPARRRAVLEGHGAGGRGAERARPVAATHF